MVRARWRWRGSRCVARVRSSALFLVAHKHKSARPARCRVVCCVFWFLGQVWALFRLISQHTDAGLGFMLVDAHLSAPHPHPLTCCWCLILSPPAVRRPRRSVCCVFWFLGLPRALFHPISQHTGQVLRLPLGHPAGTVLRFRGIRSEIGLKKPDIAAHRPRRDAAWMEAQVLGADAGARVRGVWRRVEARGSGT